MNTVMFPTNGRDARFEFKGVSYTLKDGHLRTDDGALVRNPSARLRQLAVVSCLEDVEFVRQHRDYMESGYLTVKNLASVLVNDLRRRFPVAKRLLDGAFLISWPFILRTGDWPCVIEIPEGENEARRVTGTVAARMDVSRELVWWYREHEEDNGALFRRAANRLPSIPDAVEFALDGIRYSWRDGVLSRATASGVMRTVRHPAYPVLCVLVLKYMEKRFAMSCPEDEYQAAECGLLLVGHVCRLLHRVLARRLFVRRRKGGRTLKSADMGAYKVVAAEDGLHVWDNDRKRPMAERPVAEWLDAVGALAEYAQMRLDENRSMS